jgi:hypothetical protein
MKTHATVALLLAALTTAAVSQTFAAPAAKTAHAHPVGAVERSSSTTIVRGSSVIAVYQALGAPAEKQGSDVWVYRGFNAGTAQSRDDDCDTLMITWVDGRVSDLRLVNDRALVVLAKQRVEAKKDPAPFTVASK